MVYAWLTARLVSETRRLREAQTEPRVEVIYRCKDEWISLVDIAIRNIGAGPAYDLQFTYEATTDSAGARELLRRLSEIKFISGGLNYLGPGQEYVSFWTQMTNHFDDKMATRVSVHSQSKSALGAIYRTTHTLDLSEIKGMERIGTPPLIKIAQSIEKLEKSVDHLSSGFRKLQVDVHTSEDREAERNAWEEERERLTAGGEPK